MIFIKNKIYIFSVCIAVIIAIHFFTVTVSKSGICYKNFSIISKNELRIAAIKNLFEYNIKDLPDYFSVFIVPQRVTKDILINLVEKSTINRSEVERFIDSLEESSAVKHVDKNNIYLLSENLFFGEFTIIYYDKINKSALLINDKNFFTPISSDFFSKTNKAGGFIWFRPWERLAGYGNHFFGVKVHRVSFKCCYNQNDYENFNKKNNLYFLREVEYSRPQIYVISNCGNILSRGEEYSGGNYSNSF